MTINQFTEPQKQALLDFVVLTMKNDDTFVGAKVEDVHRMLASMGYATDSDRTQRYEAAVVRVRSHSKDADNGRAHMRTIIQAFPTVAQRRLFDQALDEFVRKNMTPADAEKELMALLKKTEKYFSSEN